jgi:beta-N-acetylhexosaminidase
MSAGLARKCVGVLALTGLWIWLAFMPGPQPHASQARVLAPSDFVHPYSARVTPVVDSIDAFISPVVASMTLEQKIRQLIVVHQAGTNPGDLHALMQSSAAGGFILMDSNVPSTPSELSSITASLVTNPELPPLIGIDEEGGDVTRLPYDGFAGANSLRNAPVPATYDAFDGRGSLLASVGVNLNFGVVADQTSDSNSFIYSRSFGGDAQHTAPRVAAAVSSESAHVLSTIKHFPGHGSAPGDSHTSIPTSSLSYDQWRASDAEPFVAGIRAGASFVMFGHLAFPSVDAQPASLSPEWHRILRQSLGFTGLIITDDMQMLQRSGVPELADAGENSVRALAAGNDVLLFVLGGDSSRSEVDITHVVSAVTRAVAEGRLSEANITASVRHVLSVRRSLVPQARNFVAPCPDVCLLNWE